MAGRGIIPIPLGCPDLVQNILHFGFGGTCVPGSFCLDMCTNNLHLGPVADLNHFTLAVIYVLDKGLFALTETYLSG
jgi:hypothetical protein